MNCLVYVLAKDGTPLMPTKRGGRVRILLKQNKASEPILRKSSLREPSTDAPEEPGRFAIEKPVLTTAKKKRAGFLRQ